MSPPAPIPEQSALAPTEATATPDLNSAHRVHDAAELAYDEVWCKRPCPEQERLIAEALQARTAARHDLLRASEAIVGPPAGNPGDYMGVDEHGEWIIIPRPRTFRPRHQGARRPDRYWRDV